MNSALRTNLSNESKAVREWLIAKAKTLAVREINVYHEDFRNSIAIDVRIKSVSAAHRLHFNDYGA